SPFWIGSNAWTALMSVDLPDPEGPHTTMTSPFSTLVGQSVSTWKLPYHFEISRISIIGIAQVPIRNGWRRVAGLRASVDDRNAVLQPPHEIRSRDAHDEVNECDEQIPFDEAAIALGDLRRGTQEIGYRQHVDQRRVLEHNDRLRQQNGQHVAESLREHDLAHRLPVVEAERVAGPHLPARDRLDAGAHDFGVVRGLEHRECDHRRQERTDLDRRAGAD